MANLIYFFEFINKHNEHNELEGIFDEDVEELLGLKATCKKV